MAKFFTKKALEDVEKRWGREDEAQTLDFQDTEDFFVRMMRKTDWILDDQTWNDLDMNRNYMKMNRTYSMPGQQCLYNMLRILQFDEEELKRRNRIIEFYRMNKEKRQQVQCLLRYLGRMNMIQPQVFSTRRFRRFRKYGPGLSRRRSV